MREWLPTVSDVPGPPPVAPRAPALGAAELARITGGTLLRTSARPARGGAVDSRKVEPGNIFFALPGERTDGHRFLAAAVQAGAAALVVTRQPDPLVLAGLGDVSVVLVPAGLPALQALAADWRARFSPVVIGITGSYAKTSAKEAIATVVETRFRTLKSPGNENNEIGLPLALLRLEPDDEVAVLELGMYVRGDIAALAALARPRIGVVTAIGGVHLERAGSLAAIEEEKGRLVEALPGDGLAVLNADDRAVRRLAARSPAPVWTYGFAADADVGAEEVKSLGGEGMRFVLRAAGRRTPVTTPALGRLGVHNALAGAAAGLGVGLAPAEIAAGLAAGFGAPHRTALLSAGPWLVLDDSYNASPATVAAALDLLASLPGRRVAVLGEMLELGPTFADDHRTTGAAAAGVAALLVTIGEGGREMAAGALGAGLPPGALIEAADADAALAALLPRLAPGDVILVKGSRGVALDRLVDRLTELGRAPAGTPS
ncbi:MAG: UDP-N-acetylmuramoyl-tripeptide--D-alanyl-D-alanine ligase [Candidatus Limnocylindrales bacterium]